MRERERDSTARGSNFLEPHAVFNLGKNSKSRFVSREKKRAEEREMCRESVRERESVRVQEQKRERGRARESERIYTVLRHLAAKLTLALLEWTIINCFRLGLFISFFLSFIASQDGTGVATVTFLDGYCSTVQGLLDWFEVDLGYTELLFIHFLLSFFLCVTRRYWSSYCHRISCATGTTLVLTIRNAQIIHNL